MSIDVLETGYCFPTGPEPCFFILNYKSGFSNISSDLIAHSGMKTEIQAL